MIAALHVLARALRPGWGALTPRERTGCEVWVGHGSTRPCGAVVVERLVYLNPSICSHVHSEGALNVCAAHLVEYLNEGFATESRCEKCSRPVAAGLLAGGLLLKHRTLGPGSVVDDAGRAALIASTVRFERVGPETDDAHCEKCGRSTATTWPCGVPCGECLAGQLREDLAETEPSVKVVVGFDGGLSRDESAYVFMRREGVFTVIIDEAHLGDGGWTEAPSARPTWDPETGDPA